MRRGLLLAALVMLPMFAYSQSAPQHEKYVQVGLGEEDRANAYAAWTPGQPFYKGYGEDWEENENFNISRVKPRERFMNAQTQVRPAQDPDRKLLWWCPIGGDGWNALSSYFFGGEVWTMWSYTDIWGNWTAPLLSMPAPMLDICHKNGVKISSLAPIAWATSISTYDVSGYGYLLRKVLTDTGGADKFLKFLKYYGIDGIGFNSEFSWNGTLSGGDYSGQAFHTGMKNFLGDCYTKADSYGVPFHNCWYSLTSNNGSYGGSAALDGTNQDWFHYNGKPTSTVYFTNYGANLNQSQITVTNNFPTRSSYDVFMGVDYQAGYGAKWAELPSYKISVGIWGAHNRNLIYETRGERGSDPVQQQKTYQMILENVFTGSTKNPVNPCEITSTTRFNSMSTDAYGWAQLITARSSLMCQDGGDLSTDPFVTNFNLGNGKFFNVAGERHADVEWYNIGMQDYMPTWRWWATSTYMGRTEDEVSDDLKCEFTWDDAWLGGSCLQIAGATDQTYLQLFKTKYATAKTGDYLTIRYKVLSGSGDMAWACSKEGEETTVVEKAISSSNVDENGWTTVNTSIGGRSGIKLESSTIAQIGLKFENTSDDFKVLIGQIALTRGKPGTYTQPQAPEVEKSKMMARNYKGVDMKIIFNMDNAYTGAAKDAWVPVYNADVNTSYFRIYTQQEGKEAKVFTATTSWAAYLVAAPYVTEDAGKMRVGVSAVGLDYETESPITWGEWLEPMTMEPTIVEGTEIDKPIIKAGEEFTLKYIDVNHAPATWEVVNSATGESVQTFPNTKSITMSLVEEGSYDIKITNPDGSVAYTRGIIQVSPAATGALPIIDSFNADKTRAEVGEVMKLNYTVSRLGEGTVSRSVKVEDPNMLRFPEVVGSRPYTYMMWFKVDKFTHGSEGTNLIDKRSFNDVWPHNNWGDIWVTIRSYPQDAGAYPRYETGSSGTAQSTPHPANEISFNTYGWTEHDAPNANMMSNDHSVNEGQWTHVAVTFGTDNVQKMYFNGKKVAETTIQHINNNGVRSAGCPVYIGGTSVYKGGYNGWVDEFQVWDRVLTDAEIKTAMKGYTTAPSGLQGYWTFEEIVKDTDGNNVFPNKGQKGSGYNAAIVTTVGQKGENTSEVVQTVVSGSNEELGNPMIGGSYQVKTSAEWTAPGAKLTKTDNGANISYDASGSYTVGLTLKNMWGSDSKTIDFVAVPLGIEDAVVEEMGVYPNPFTDFVNLCFAKEGTYTIEIVALDGKLIESKQLNVSANEGVRLDINGEKGMYIIRVLNANNAAVRTLKVVKK